MNFCRACGRDFGSLRAFDAHRVGTHAYTYREGLRMEPMVEDGRRCLTADEMPERFARNKYGRWSLADHLQRGRAHAGVHQERLKGCAAC